MNARVGVVADVSLAPVDPVSPDSDVPVVSAVAAPVAAPEPAAAVVVVVAVDGVTAV